jgi:hypothetical protein
VSATTGAALAGGDAPVAAKIRRAGAAPETTLKLLIRTPEL